MNCKNMIAVALAVLFLGGMVAFADTTSSEDGFPLLPGLAGNHAHGYTDTNTQADAYEPEWFGFNAAVDVILYKDRLWEIKQTNDYSTRGKGEYYVGGRVAFNAWEFLTGKE